MLNLALYLVLGLTTLWLFLRHVYSYWRRQGFPEITPTIPWGNMLPTVNGQKSIGMTLAGLYNDTKEAFAGIYVFFQPQLVIRDLELARRIMTTDFEFFHDHDVFSNEQNDPLSVNLFSEKGQKWKKLRQIMTPLFTTGKLKTMFPTLLAEIDKLDTHLEKSARLATPINLRENVVGYVLNVVASVLFGIDVDIIRDPDHVFKKNYDRVSVPVNLKEVIRQSLVFFLPKVIKLFKIPSLPREIREYFIDLVTVTVNHRETNHVTRNDLLQLMIDLRRSPDVESRPSIEVIAGNAFVFFIAGSDTSASTATYCLYELMRAPEAMEKLQSEVVEALEKSKGELSYDVIQEMKYLDLCVKETLRKYPGLPTTNRLAAKDYKVPGHKQVIPKGTAIVIPTMAIQMDEKYFPDPDQFIPERFEKDSGLCNENAYFPFGLGPRQCIAFRMGFIVAKAVIVKMLYKYTLELTSDKELSFDTKTFTVLPEGAIDVQLRLRQ